MAEFRHKVYLSAGWPLFRFSCHFLHSFKSESPYFEAGIAAAVQLVAEGAEVGEEEDVW